MAMALAIRARPTSEVRVCRSTPTAGLARGRVNRCGFPAGTMRLRLTQMLEIWEMWAPRSQMPSTASVAMNHQGRWGLLMSMSLFGGLAFSCLAAARLCRYCVGTFGVLSFQMSLYSSGRGLISGVPSCFVALSVKPGPNSFAVIHGVGVVMGQLWQRVATSAF